MARGQNEITRYSRRYERGALGDLADGRSAIGKFVRRLEAELIDHLGHDPSVVERLLIERVVRVQLEASKNCWLLAG
jgi:hypothetical protein